jgi:tetratricopeptide (TPR) repeat protein
MADHGSQPLTLLGNAPDLAMAAAIGLIEFAITWLLLHGRMRVIDAAAGHAMVVALIAGQLLLFIKWRRDLRLTMILLAFTLALGPLGPAATLLTAVMTFIFAREAKPFEAWYRTLFPDSEDDSSFFEGMRSQQSDPQTSIMPLIDVLTFGSHDQKQALLNLITANFRPAFAQVLKTALNDNNNAIRVQAASAITKIENEFMGRALELTRRAQEHPDDPEAITSIARHYDDYAYIGLLDIDREKDCRKNAIDYYRHYLTLEPTNVKTRIAIGRILVRERRYEEAVEWFEQSSLPDETTEGAVWYVESLFRAGKFEKLRTFVTNNWKRFQDGAALPLEVAEAIRLWLPQTAEGGA